LAQLAEDIAEAIRECDVGVVPNRRSIFSELNTPTRIFEYLALGKPVIAPRAPGIQDYFDDDSLVFFELGNWEDLARQIEYSFSTLKRRWNRSAGAKVYLTHTWAQEESKLVHVEPPCVSRTSGGNKSDMSVDRPDKQILRTASLLALIFEQVVKSPASRGESVSC
jgi:spore maturation protein CgeB